MNESRTLEELKNIAKEMNKPIEELLYEMLSDAMGENEILNRDVEAMKHNYNLLVRTIENGESMTQKFENGLTYQDYKSRNEKAVEYIEIIDNRNSYIDISELRCIEKLLKGGDE